MKKTVSRAARTALIAVLLALGAGAAMKMPEAVQSFLPRVETLRAEEINFSPAVSASGVIGKSEAGWYAVVAVSEGDINSVVCGQSASLSGAALAEGVYKAQVSSVADTARQLQNGAGSETVVDVTLELENGDNNLRAGYTVQASIRTAPDEVICVLPYSAICQDEAGEYVYVMSGSAARRRDIVTGRELSSGAEIVSGLTPADEVIAKPALVREDAYVLRSEA